MLDMPKNEDVLAIMQQINTAAEASNVRAL
jgi:hypothetical protein